MISTAARTCSPWCAALASALAACGAPNAARREPEHVVETVEPATVAQPPGAQRGCDEYEGPRVLGRIADPRLSEISGLAASRAHPGVLYVQNDSGEPHARIFAIDTSGRVLAEHALGDHAAFDLEEIAIGPGSEPARDAIYLADIGDNDARNGRGGRPSIHILRVAEPEPPRSVEGAPAVTTLSPVDRIELRYPEAPVDCEAFFLDPSSGDLYLLGKVAEGAAPIFVARAPLSTTTPNALARAGETLTAGDLGDSITASSLSFDGSRLAVRTYRHAFLFTRVDDEPWTTTLARTPVTLPRLHEPQGEAIAFADARGTLLSITEGVRAPVQALDPRCDDAQPL